MFSWNNGTDCCSAWEGVTCDLRTGHVIGLDLTNSCLLGSTIASNSTLFHLFHLQSLSLASNYFNGASISPSFAKLSSLRNLSLSSMDLEGEVPQELSHLSKLVSLDLSGNDLTFSSLKELIENFTELSQLVLDGMLFNSFEAESLVNLSCTLTILSLSDCSLRMNSLEVFLKLPRLQVLNAASNRFKGSLPEFNSNLSNNNFSGPFPYWIGNLTLLTSLDLSSNRLSGPLPSWAFGHSKLQVLDLHDNSLSGALPSWLSTLPLLNQLLLQNNQFDGHISEFQSYHLEKIDLSHNKLHGQIPRSVFKLVNLTLLDLSSNNLNGSIELDGFYTLENLWSLDLSENNLSLTISDNSVNSRSSRIEILKLSSCNLRVIPNLLKGQTELAVIDLSRNNIGGLIPKWLLSMGGDVPHTLNLSHNSLSGFDASAGAIVSNFSYLDLQSNRLQGSLPIPGTPTTYYSAANNKLKDEISPSFCDAIYLEFLDLSYNKLSGILPPCMATYPDFLQILNLQGNNFGGTIPFKFSSGSGLTSLDLSYNQLQGSVPKSLANCSKLEILNLGNNILVDSFPSWLAALPELKVLVLRRITQSWSSMMSNDNESQLTYLNANSGYSYYHSTVVLISKGLEVHFERILTTFKAIDFSNNRLKCEIPKAIGNLEGLHVLNLSSNSFMGGIPMSLGNISALESLDLSRNNLSGEIPPQLTSLTFLAILDVSDKQLGGTIPRGKQFDTFPSTSYKGNSALCGFPLSKLCGKTEGAAAPASTLEEGSDSGSILVDLDWKVVLIGYGCGFMFGAIFGSLFRFNPLWSRQSQLHFVAFFPLFPDDFEGMAR
ncbi:Leucine-rich repeat [Dillenia turbinata]|uniref:Leucine-rich repeat n=1 Tax=Dillenia turbinata TaxID=194707 RepID=A0AAN8VRK8_9MAGN